MTKIITGVAGLVATVALVGATAFAQFTTTVSANDVVFATGTASLEAKYGASDWANEFNLLTPSASFGKFIPGTPKKDTFQVRNVGDVPLALSLRLVSAPEGDWNLLKDVMLLTVYDGTEAGAGDEFKTFNAWNAIGGVSLNVTLPPVAVSDPGQQMTVEVKLDENANNSYTNKSVKTNWVLTGSQVGN